MEKLCTLLLALILALGLTAQSCLPEGITFYTQAKIDSFQYNYPGCTEIEGDVVIHGSSNISSLLGLDIITEIGGHLKIIHNYNLQTLNGLESLTTIGGGLDIENNWYIDSLSGLDNLSFIGSTLSIRQNWGLESLSGLENLAYIGGGLKISDNNELTSISALENVSINGPYLRIEHNQSLIACEIQCICDYLNNPLGLVSIYNNGDGCNSTIEVGYACGGSLPCLPDGEYNFASQSDIDNFQFVFPNCNDLSGSIEITGAIYNLNGLNTITTIEDNLVIGSTSLTDLAGLENLSAIGGTLYINNDYSLQNLSGLHGLESVGENFELLANHAIKSIDSISNLSTIGGDILIEGNDSITSLSGLENIDPNSIENLIIKYNNSLSSCHAASICDYLAAPTGVVDIYSNSQGCNSPQEIAENCGLVMPCLPYGNYYFSNQNDIDSFDTYFPTCTELNGMVVIAGDDISNLNGLNSITTFTGDLYIGWFYSDNPGLINLSGLNNTDTIYGSLHISNNINLTYISGLNELTFIGGDLSLGHYLLDPHPLLTDISGLSNLNYVRGTLLIDRNNSLQELNGLNNLSRVDGDVVIGTTFGWPPHGNPALENLDALENLLYIGGGLGILGNEELGKIYGLNNLDTIFDGLYIEGNPSLSSLEGLGNVNIVDGSGGIWIEFNEELSDCAVLSICNYLNNPAGDIIIINNSIGCNSPEEVLDSCEANAVNINEVFIADKLSIYPNPTHATIIIELQAQSSLNTTLTISSTNGQQLIRQPITQPQTEIDISHLPVGIYIVKVWNDKDVMVQKIIKQ